MHACVCMRVCVHAWVCVHVCAHICVCLYRSACAHACKHVCVCVHVECVSSCSCVCECVHGWMLFCDVSLCIPVQLCVREICVLYFSLFVDCHSQLHVETFSFTHNKQMYLLT